MSSLPILPNFTPLPVDHDEHRPAASYLRYDTRTDGWNGARRAAFLAHLADHGNVARAAQAVGKCNSGAYALRRSARGFLFALGWEAALLLARRRIVDELYARANAGEDSVWDRSASQTVHSRYNSRLAFSLLDRTDPVAAPTEIVAIMANFDDFLQMVECADGDVRDAWALFDSILPPNALDARSRVRSNLLLCDKSADLGSDDDDYAAMDRDDMTEYKSCDGLTFPVVGVASDDAGCPVELFGEHRADQHVRPGGAAEGKEQVCAAALGLGETVCGADQEAAFAGSPVTPGLDPLRQRDRRQLFPVFVERNGDRRGQKQRRRSASIGQFGDCERPAQPFGVTRDDLGFGAARHFSARNDVQFQAAVARGSGVSPNAHMRSRL